MVEEPHMRLDQFMRARSLEIKKRWVQIASEAGISTSALSQIRKGDYRPSPHTARALDDAFEWGPGSVNAILSGGEPTPAESASTEPDRPERTVTDAWDDFQARFQTDSGRQAVRGALAVLQAQAAVETDPEERATLRRLIARITRWTGLHPEPADEPESGASAS